MATLITVPACIRLGLDITTWRHTFLDMKFKSVTGHRILVSSTSTIIGSWVGALFLPLDWDRPWQRWPLPLIYGGTLGYVVGVLFFSQISGQSARGKINKFVIAVIYHRLVYMA